MAYAGEKEFRFLIFESRERLRYRVLGPALRIRFGCVLQKPRKGCSKIWGEPCELVMQRDCRSPGDHQVVAESEGLYQLGFGDIRRYFTKRVKAGEFGVEGTFGWHGCRLL